MLYHGHVMKRPAAPPPEKEPRWLPAAVAALAALFALLATSSLLSESQTSDEAIHIAAGYAHLTRADFLLNPEHPPLAKEIAAIPLLFMRVRLPAGGSAWEEAHRSAFQLPLGEEFLYRNGVPFASILTAARLPIVGLGSALCVTVFAFSRRLFGWRAGLLSMTLCALCPNVLAHARLVTTDLCVSLFFLLSLLCLHRWMADPTPVNLILTGVSCGLTLASKFSGVVIVPALLAVILTAPRRPVASFGAMMACAVATLAATYAVVHLPIYVSALWGVVATVTGGTEAFLLGEFSTRGWWYYYPVAMLLKTPVPGLVLFALIPVSYLVPGERGVWRRHLVLIVPLMLFGAFSLAAARNVGLRHVLPVYPVLFVLAGRAALLAARIPGLPLWAGRIGLMALLLWYAGSTLGIHPAYLAYFNELGGGPANGWRLLSDSNIDWGQDFIRLKDLMRREKVDEIILGYYGNQDPAYYGIAWQHLPGAGHIKPPPDRLLSSPRTLVAVSVMTLQGMFQRDKEVYAWLREREPLARVGYSIYVYDITGDGEAFARLADVYAKYRLDLQERWARERVASAGRDRS